MASHYVDLLRRYQPNGPYRLGGHSMGGLVAVLMAQKLAGEVSSLILFDSPSPQHLLTRQESQSWSDEAAQLSLLMGLSDEQLSVFLQQPLADQQQSLAQLLSAEDLFVQRMGATLLAHLSALNTIQELAQYDVPTLLLCAERTTEDVAHTVGWDAILSDLRCVPVAGDHNRMLDPPFIEHVAKVIFSHYAIIN
jgi:thioesterase domain-containing protein